MSRLMVTRRSSHSLFAPISYDFSFSAANGVAVAGLIGCGLVPAPLNPVAYSAYVMKCGVHAYCNATFGSTREVFSETGIEANGAKESEPAGLMGFAGTPATFTPS